MKKLNIQKKFFFFHFFKIVKNCQGMFSEKLNEMYEARRRCRLIVLELPMPPMSAVAQERRKAWKVERTASNGGAALRRIVKLTNNEWHCTCYIPHHYGLPCKDILSVIETQRSARGENRPEYAETDAIDPMLSIGRAFDALKFDASDASAIDTHHLLPVQLLPHAKVVPVNANASCSESQTRRQRRRSVGETQQRKRYKCSRCGRNDHTARRCHRASEYSETNATEE
jgi:hypothetical protein